MLLLANQRITSEDFGRVRRRDCGVLGRDGLLGRIGHHSSNAIGGDILLAVIGLGAQTDEQSALLSSVQSICAKFLENPTFDVG